MKALAAVLLLSLAAPILAQTAAPAAGSDGKKIAQPDRLRKLTKRERAEKIRGLGPRHQDFVSDVEPIIQGAELDTFLALGTEAHRDAFVEDFWHRRDVAAGTSNHAFRDAYYQRLEIAKEQFKKVTSDRAKMFLIQGPPSDVVRTECARLLQPIEIWKYAHIPKVGAQVRLLFYKSRYGTDYRLWSALGGSSALSELIVADSAALSSGDASSARRLADESVSNSPYAYISRIQLECKDGDEIMRAITSMVQSRVDLMRLFEPPQVETEDVQKMLRSMVIVNPDAPKLAADFSVRYPAKDGSRTDVQMTLMVPRDQVKPAQAGDAEVYTVDVVGEVLRNGSLWEKYRYRFDFPGDFQGDKLPIVIDRLLRPAEYLSRIKVVDANTGAEVIVESALSVPEIFVPEAEATQTASVELPAADPALSAKSVSDLKHELEVPETRLRIIPMSRDIVSGIQTVETMITGGGIRAVEFWLDGRKIAVRRSPPYALDLDFGTIPHTRRIRAVALGENGEPLTGDEIAVNVGTDPFRVRITSPRVAPHLSGSTRIEMDVRVPEGDELDVVELYWNQHRLAVLYDAPFVQTVEIPASDGVGFLRAVARVKGDTQAPVEDVVVINTPAYMEELNVHLVELPTTVMVDGKPTSHLTEKAFRITDEGKPVSLAKFEYVKNLPLSVGVAIDSSGSMQPRMEEAQKAGAQFFEKIMRPGDKAFLVAFDTEPQTIQKWSTRVADMHAGLARLRAEETTALYDAVVYALYNFQGIRGQRALVVISDGKDTASKFTYEQALEYARRSGVPIYTIGIGIRGTEMDVRYKLSKLSQETGGWVYYIEQARDLQHVYDAIQNELRSQYILGFYPGPDVRPGGKWREINVQVTEGKARTIRGYFP